MELSSRRAYKMKSDRNEKLLGWENTNENSKVQKNFRAQKVQPNILKTKEILQ